MSDNSNMGFLDHLEILRWHIIRAAIAVTVIGLLAFIFKDYVFDNILLAPRHDYFPTYRALCFLGKYFHIDGLCAKPTPLTIINSTISGQFSTHITIAIYTGLLLGFPYLLWELWRFIKPALYPKEQKMGRRGVYVISFLFIIGVLFGFFIVTPISTEFFSSYSVSADVKNMVDLNSYITMVVSATFATGVVFELPVFIYFLSKVGLITSTFLKKYRKHAVVVILVIAAIVTPPDAVSQIIVTIPMVILYEVGIVVAKRIEKKKAKELATISED